MYVNNHHYDLAHHLPRMVLVINEEKVIPLPVPVPVVQLQVEKLNAACAAPGHQHDFQCAAIARIKKLPLCPTPVLVVVAAATVVLPRPAGQLPKITAPVLVLQTYFHTTVSHVYNTQPLACVDV